MGLKVQLVVEKIGDWWMKIGEMCFVIVDKNVLTLEGENKKTGLVSS